MIRNIVKIISTTAVALLVSSAASATVIDTTSTWSGSVNNGWFGSGQSFNVGAPDTYFDDITFSFASAANGKTFSFALSDALNGGNTLFSTSFNIVNGFGFIDVNTSVLAGSTVYALIDYNGYNGASAYFQGNVFAGGNSNFGATGSKVAYSGLDHVFVANFTGGASSQVPEPAPMVLFGLGLLGLAVARRRQTK